MTYYKHEETGKVWLSRYDDSAAKAHMASHGWREIGHSEYAALRLKQEEELEATLASLYPEERSR